ncbi:TetR/AcrR family transcriptional regulator, partial [Christensenellaceae bacterium OttesenSCG-928-K19]|nr:TetR/AcrR family transcriptional regulator [Christensenellaceae bacterium OttesenSCG-928-K19]
VEIYIEKGEFRKVDDVFYTTRTIIEIMAWWSMHIMNDAFDIDTTITKGKAKAICMDVLLNAYSR